MPHQDLSQEAQLIELGRIEGIDPVKALKAMSGQTQLYLKLVKGFAQEHATRADEIKTLLQSNDIATLERRCHSLKSYCAYIGAYEFAERCAQAEALLHEGNAPPQLLAEIADGVDYFVQNLSQRFEHNRQISDAQHKSFDSYQFKKALIAVLPLLQRSDFAAEDAMQQLQSLSQGSCYDEIVGQISALVDDVEYEAATEQVLNLLEDLL